MEALSVWFHHRRMNAGRFLIVHPSTYEHCEVRCPMSIQVRYFSSLREMLGRSEDRLESHDSVTVAEVWSKVSAGQSLPANTLCAVNMEYVKLEDPVKDGDEVAFFPPVTGG